MRPPERRGRKGRRRSFGAHAAHLRVQLLRCSLTHARCARCAARRFTRIWATWIAESLVEVFGRGSNGSRYTPHGVGKKQVRQVRQQMRQVQPKAATATTPGQTRKQRERYVQAGGMLQGYAPDFVIRMGYIAVAVGAVCLLAIAAVLVFVPAMYGWPVAIAA